MRIGCLQFAPVKGDVNNNLSRADGVLLKQNPEDLDLLVLPELAFTGYYFKSLNEIFPHLEPTGSGTTSLWARTVALKYDCTVIAGYPEKVDVTNKWPASPEYYNSAIIVDGEGQTTGGYRKSHLYSIDETWALEGQGGFYKGSIAGVENAMLGISMDITPYRFQTPWESFEFAHRVTQVRSNLVIVSLAWPTNQEGRLFSRAPKEPDMETLTHWISRLEPIVSKETDEEVIVVFANRTGTEDGVVYAGTSAVLGIKEGEVSVYGILGRSDRELLVVDTDKEPYGKLVYRPEPNGMPLINSRPLNNGAAVPPLTASAPIPPPPPAPLLRPRVAIEANAPTSGVPSISEVLHAKDSTGTPASTVSPRLRGQPKLSLKTNPEQLEPPFPSVSTPTGPSPTPFSKRPRISIPPVAESWTQRYIDSQMKSPVSHPMVISPPPVQILGGEVSILLSPLYSATDGPMKRPWDSPIGGKGELSPAQSDFTDFTGLSSAKDASFPESSQRVAASSGSNAYSRREPPTPIKETLITLPALSTVTASGNNVGYGTQNIAGPKQLNAAGHHRVGSQATNNGLSNGETNLERFALYKGHTTAPPPPLLPMTYAPPQTHRLGSSPRRNPKRLHSPSSPETSNSERSPNLIDNVVRGVRSESRGGTGRGRSTGPYSSVLESASRTTTPKIKDREQSRGRSRTHKHGGASQAHKPSSRKKSRPTAGTPIDLSKFQVIEERPSADCAIHGTRARSASQGQVLRKGSASPPAHKRSESARPVDLSQFQLIEEWRSESCAIHGSRSRSASQDQATRRASTSSPTHNRSASARRARTVRHTPTMSNLMTNVKKTPPSARKVNTQRNTGISNPSPIAGSKPYLPAQREEQSMSQVKLSPTAVSASPTTSNDAFPNPVAFHLPWGPERQSWVESWLPTLFIANQREPLNPPNPSLGTPIDDPATPRAMVTASESRGTGNSPPSCVTRLEVMVNGM